MPLHGLMALVCAGALAAADPANPVSAPENSDKTVSATLAVQTALQQSREHLLHGEYKAAVSVLESQLPFINGNKIYLKALEDAYRGLVRELRLAKQHADAQRYLERLLYLDKGAILDRTLADGSPSATARVTETAAKPAESTAVKTSPTFRGKNLEERQQATPIQDRLASSDVASLLKRAEQEFDARHFPEARRLYEQIARLDQAAVGGDPAQCERFAYCRLYSIVERVNQGGPQKPSWPDLENEVRGALTLAPRLESYGKNLLSQMEKYRCEAAPAAQAEPSVPVRHYERDAQGWLLAETTNFRIFHKQTTDLAEQTAQVVERARAKVLQKWFSGGEPWNLKCDVYVHPTADAYSQETGKYNSPGHSSIRMENGRMIVRRIDVHADNPNMLVAVLPHETTHVVLADAFGERLVPRWVDEGMAVLSEPREKVQRHLDNLSKCRQNNELFHLRDLMQMDNYPQNPRYVGAFYAQSVSLVEFLANQKGPQEFTLYLHDAMRYGEEKALERHYGYQKFTDLEEKWFQSAFREQAVAGRTP
jgi:tetratricopeptide (TPR) repeat protein